jgi:transcriptional regulator with XRE-family HTH domain
MPEYKYLSREYVHQLIDNLFDKLDRAKNPPPPQPLRNLRHVRQADVAKKMGVTQPAVSQIEMRKEIRVDMLRSYVEACGSSLELVAKLPSGQLAPLDVKVIGPDAPDREED